MDTCTITYCDVAENHKGMEKLGIDAPRGLSKNDLDLISDNFRALGASPILVDLRILLPAELQSSVSEAYILVIQRGLDYLLHPYATSNEFYNEQQALNKDKKAFMYGRVVNKKLRHNLCFYNFDRAADYENKKGTVMSFERLPYLNYVKSRLIQLMGEMGQHLIAAEGNYYYDLKECCITAHGDSERKLVVGVRTGATMPLYYQWYNSYRALGIKGEILLNHGDIYFMSEKAVGSDWKTPSLYTLRHAAGLPEVLAKHQKK